MKRSLIKVILATLLFSTNSLADWGRQPDVPVQRSEKGDLYYDHDQFDFFSKLTKTYPTLYTLYDLSNYNRNKIPSCRDIENGFSHYTRYWSYSYSADWGEKIKPTKSCFYSLVDVSEGSYSGGIGPGYAFQYLLVKNFYFPSIDKNIACSVSMDDHTYYENGAINLTWIIPPLGWATTKILESNARDYLLKNNVMQFYHGIINNDDGDAACNTELFSLSFKKAFTNSKKIKKSTLEFIQSHF
ncbi:MAG: hypothetical protein ACXVCE_12715 [Bacteriovorax sp.]